MEMIRMDSSVVSKSTFEEADDHVSFYNDKSPLERLNFACDIINSIFNSSPEKKVDRTILSSRKHAEFVLTPKDLADIEQLQKNKNNN